VQLKNPLIKQAGYLLLVKNNATGIPPSVVTPFKVPEITPVIIFAGSLFILSILSNPLINSIEKKIIIQTHIYMSGFRGKIFKQI
jgi:hypothetical protein